MPDIEYTTTASELTSIADAIRTKGGTSASLVYPTGFVSAIENLPSGGGGGLQEYTSNTYYNYGNAIDYDLPTGITESTLEYLKVGYLQDVVITYESQEYLFSTLPFKSIYFSGFGAYCSGGGLSDNNELAIYCEGLTAGNLISLSFIGLDGTPADNVVADYLHLIF